MPTVTIRPNVETNARLRQRLAKSGGTLSLFVRAAVIEHLDAALGGETRLQSLTRTLEKNPDTGETDVSTTYKARIKEKLRAKHSVARWR